MTTSTLQFRNVDIAPDAPVSQWPYEGLVAAIERGMLSDWRNIAGEIDAAPWGRIARWVEEYSRYGDEQAVAALLLERVHRARQSAQESDKNEVARQVRVAIKHSGMTAREFAYECGTSPSRLSTYATGKVQVSAALLVRIEHTAAHLAPSPPTKC